MRSFRDDADDARRTVAKVRPGDVVRMIPSALACGLNGRAKSEFARVVRISPPFRIKVQRHGLRHAEWYWAGFWRVTRRRRL